MPDGPTHSQRFLRARRKERILGLVEVAVPFAGAGAAVLLLWRRGVHPLDLWLLAGMYSLTLIGIGVGFHRYFSHRSFETSLPVKILLAVVGSMAAQGPVHWWGSIHRIHHARSDQAGDPHSPNLHGPGLRGRLKGLVYAQFAWLFLHDLREGDGRRHGMDLALDPTLAAIDRVYLIWVFLGLAIPAAVGGLVTGSWAGAATGLLWGGLVRIFLVHHSFWSINSICHLYGSAPYPSRDSSRNNPWIGLVAFGDGWHNNHHMFPAAAVHGFHWWQVDVNGYVIRLLEAVGLAWEVKRPSRDQIASRRVDATTARQAG